MVQTRAGVEKARATIIEKYGRDYWRKLGSTGGSRGGLKGFAVNRDLARIAGKKGGLTSHRGPSYVYSVYEDDRPVAVGSIKEVATALGVSEAVIYRAATHSHHTGPYTVTRHLKD